MEGKLIKNTAGEYYLIVLHKNLPRWFNVALELSDGYYAIASSSCIDGVEELHKLSLTNCQAIERGYDLDELAKKYCTHEPKNAKELRDVNLAKLGFKDGFQKALEILGYKKFTEEDMIKAYNTNHLSQECKDNGREIFIQSLQQTEWDVVIEMEKYGFCEGCRRSGMWHCAHADVCGNAIELEKPKLDSEGRLILKRKK